MSCSFLIELVVVCRTRGKPFQLHHVDEDPSNNDRGNLAVLCVDCHRETQIRGGFDRKLDAMQICLYRNDWLTLVSQKLSASYAPPPNALPPQAKPLGMVDETGKCLFCADEPVIVWRMPRGALVLGHLLAGPPGWATIADYYSYNGAWRAGTHYHTSYRPYLWEQLGGFERECRKLQIERADFEYARKPLQLMSDIRDGRVTVHRDGKLEGQEVEKYHQPELMRIFVQEDVPFPHVPEMYFRLSISGPLRDMADAVDDICEEGPAGMLEKNRLEEIKGIRRAARIEAHQVLAKDDPAMVNLLEVIETFDSNADFKRYHSWLRDFRAVLHEAVEQVHATRQ